MTGGREAAVRSVLESLLTRRCYEFRWGKERCLIQPDNNKGCDYLSLWRTDPSPACLGRALYEVMDGFDADTVRELLEQPCIRGKSYLERLAAGELTDENGEELP